MVEIKAMDYSVLLKLNKLCLGTLLNYLYSAGKLESTKLTYELVLPGLDLTYSIGSLSQTDHDRGGSSASDLERET